VSFFDWLLIGGPFTLVFLPIAWLLVTRVLFRSDIGEIEGGRQHFDEEYRKLGLSPGREDSCWPVFARTASLWIASPLLKGIAVAGMTPLAGSPTPGSQCWRAWRCSSCPWIAPRASAP
jgi:sodium-dependent dicarboxylate transporter 2/3/5